VLGHRVAAPSTLWRFLRSFTFGHVGQLDRVLGDSLTCAWRAGAGPGEERLVVDVDSFVGEVHGYHKQGAAFGYTSERGYHPLLASRADTGEVLHIRLRKGSANTARGVLRFVEEPVARVERAGARGEKLLRAASGFWSNKVFARESRLELPGRGAPAGARAPSDRGDRRARLADARRLPRDERGPDRRQSHHRSARRLTAHQQPTTAPRLPIGGSRLRRAAFALEAPRDEELLGHDSAGIAAGVAEVLPRSTGTPPEALGLVLCSEERAADPHAERCERPARPSAAADVDPADGTAHLERLVRAALQRTDVNPS
jgi:Transposase DDE domain group 1